MTESIFSMKFTNRAANLLWLFLLWCIIYAFTVWNYGSFHGLHRWLTPANENLSLAGDVLAWTILLVEFSLNFPAKHLPVRFLCGLAAVVALLVMLPSY